MQKRFGSGALSGRTAERIARRFAPWLLGLAWILTAGPAQAADADGVSKDEDAKLKARVHFERGLEHLAGKRLEAALAEFLRSRELYATRAATQNAAVTYRELARYAESLDLFEALLAEFSDLPNRDAVMKVVHELEAQVGGISVIETPPGAMVIVDGRARGRTPLRGTIRVGAGAHVVRVVKEGAEPLEVEVHVAGGQNVQVEGKLQVLARAGTIEVTESTGATATVLIDGVQVGTTPWEGLVPIGNRVVLLVGQGNLGTQPVAVPVELGKSVALKLTLEPLRCAVRVSPTPAGALVAIDRVDVARGSWDGALRCGDHMIEVANEGFLPVARKITLDEGIEEIVAMSLERDPTSAIWAERHPARVFVEGGFGAVLVPSLGGDAVSKCEGPCELGRTLGGHASLRAGYQLGSGLGFAAEAGYLWLGTSISNRSIGLVTVPSGMPIDGIAHEELRLHALTAGAVLSYQSGDQWPWLLALGSGVAFGSMNDERESRADPAGQNISVGTVSESFDARFMYVAPEARLAYRLLDRLEIGGGIRPMVLVALTQPKWSAGKELPAGSLGLVDYEGETLAGRWVLALAGNVGLRFSFY